MHYHDDKQAQDSDEEVYAAAKAIDSKSTAFEEDISNSRLQMEVLQALDHTKIEYESFEKSFYTPADEVASMSIEQVKTLRNELQLQVEGDQVPNPIQSFMQLKLDRKMLNLLMKLGLEAPTAIQAQTFPVALSGRDMIGIAKTGSGKTLAFTIPMIWHVMDQRELSKGEGPIAIVISPTRELAHQIYTQVKMFTKLYGAECVAVYGGVGKWEQVQALRKGAEVLIATPGRLIELIRKKTIRTNRVTFVVLDEADRMFELGFESQLRSMLGQLRPDRQSLLFSATFRPRIEQLARAILTKPIKVTVGKAGQANEVISQIPIVLLNHGKKWEWLMKHLEGIVAQGRVLIFANSKVGCEELSKNLDAMHYRCCLLHGDKSQYDRSSALADFKSGKCSVMVATDVAARGLDIRDVKTVVNYDVAKNIDIHVHRIGRTGRMGVDGFEPGVAYTLITHKEMQFAGQLVCNMDTAGQPVSAELLAIAERDPGFNRGKRKRLPSSERSRCHEDDGDGDGEDRQEMERWTANRRKTVADRRKGLGFHSARGNGNSASSRPGLLYSSFVKASTTATLRAAGDESVGSNETAHRSNDSQQSELNKRSTDNAKPSSRRSRFC